MRPVALLGALLLSACSTDVFVGLDGGDASSDVGKADAPGSLEGGPSTATSVQCAKSACTNTACCTSTTWDFSSCAPTSTEDSGTCLRWLSCDDPSDCPTSTPVCCASQIGQATSNPSVTATHCDVDCPAGAVRLCAENGDCTSNNCQNYPGTPTWLKSCQ